MFEFQITSKNNRARTGIFSTPHGTFVVGNKEIPVRAIQTRSEKLKDLVSIAYKEKYNTPGSAGYVKEMSRSPSKDATMELVET